MRIINTSDITAKCLINDDVYILHAGESIEIEKINTINISHDYCSYYCAESNSSKILKFLSFFDDPFRLKKEYYLVINSHFDGTDCYTYNQIDISHKTYYANVETHTYYDFFVLTCGRRKLIPQKMYVSNSEKLLIDFENNDRKLSKWNAIWNILIEPIIFELIGFVMIYLLFSIWFGKSSLYIVIALMILSGLIEGIIFALRKKGKCISKFKELLSDAVIQEFFQNEIR